jgi:microsomal dipeptidase-like Zn-dependent dipeptidase
MLTIAHIFRNDLAHPVEGISADEKRSIGMEWCYKAERDNCDLSEIGIAVAKRMLELGMVIDLTHSTPAARRNVFEINRHISAANKGRLPRPLTFTHVGLQSVFETHNHVPELQSYKFYDIDEEEILAICDCEGVIGVIPENFWLTGVDRKIKGSGIEPGDYRNGINFVIETMSAINEKTIRKDFSNISIGTDFDGFADAPKDLYVPKHLIDLVNAVKGIKGITSKQVEAITSGNARRLLERGWGNPRPAVNIPQITMVGTCSEKINRVY